eukprot:TRINITY_DN36372_c0_g1_i1.p1 TRINITY_DN36372_c0_g1~~TRINITY_DN36372_c0_g1_i1.p1  ORF type:complete len:155 (+),score=27.61 TRINITY_DN36372_c0_g1_i1:3-467(+)
MRKLGVQQQQIQYNIEKLFLQVQKLERHFIVASYDNIKQSGSIVKKEKIIEQVNSYFEKKFLKKILGPEWNFQRFITEILKLNYEKLKVEGNTITWLSIKDFVQEFDNYFNNLSAYEQKFNHFQKMFETYHQGKFAYNQLLKIQNECDLSLIHI